MRIQFLLCEEWFQRQISRLLTDPSELFSSQLLMGCRTGSFVYSRKPVLSAESEAKARAIAEKSGTLEMKWFWFVSRGKLWREQKSDSKQQKLFSLLRFLRREKTQDWIGRGLEPIYLTPQPGLHFAIFCGCKQPGKCTGCLVTCCYVWKRGSTAW